MGLVTSRGCKLFAAYGNTPTDIRAYAAHGIPKVIVLNLRPQLCSCRTLAVAVCERTAAQVP